ncbi:GAF domain-containing protein [Actinoplanes sp. NPDC026623]|uniref:GAF domain-containing protein n=1 Tax=Actinoplanes sp. NPDC026623 TaxID=3155610 RepID=UPI0034089B32
MASPSSAADRPPPHGPLAEAMITLAGAPDYSPRVDSLLMTIAGLAAERVAAASHASVTALRGKAYTTVAVSEELITEIDQVQYADNAGPCIEALDLGVPVAVPNTGATVQWPGFHQAAPRMGLHASVSVPLYAGRGDAVAALNLYSHDRAAMTPLIAGICTVHDHPDRDPAGDEHLAGLDAGGRELVAGYAEALSIRATVRLALELIRTDNRCSPDDAYLSLCIRAGEAGTDLAAAAAALINHNI